MKKEKLTEASVKMYLNTSVNKRQYHKVEFKMLKYGIIL
jgi:hypothetical protein